MLKNMCCILGAAKKFLTGGKCCEEKDRPLLTRGSRQRSNSLVMVEGFIFPEFVDIALRRMVSGQYKVLKLKQLILSGCRGFQGLNLPLSLIAQNHGYWSGACNPGVRLERPKKAGIFKSKGRSLGKRFGSQLDMG